MEAITDEDLKWILVDFDGTLAELTPPPYKVGKPILPMLKACEVASDLGYKIIIFTSRHSSEYRVIEHWLEKHKVQHKFILTGKPLAKWIVDDKSMKPDEFIKLMLENKK